MRESPWAEGLTDSFQIYVDVPFKADDGKKIIKRKGGQGGGDDVSLLSGRRSESDLVGVKDKQGERAFFALIGT